MYTPIQVDPRSLVLEDEFIILESITNEPLELKTGYSYRQRFRRAKIRTVAVTEVTQAYGSSRLFYSISHYSVLIYFRLTIFI